MVLTIYIELVELKVNGKSIRDDKGDQHGKIFSRPGFGRNNRRMLAVLGGMNALRVNGNTNDNLLCAKNVCRIHEDYPE